MTEQAQQSCSIHHISSLKQYIEIINEFQLSCQKYNCERWIFRGQIDNPSWGLKTGLGRDHTDISIEIHNKQVNVFRELINATKWKHFYDKPVLQLGQHYGLKTNLLDWTIDPIIALFFSLTDKEFDNKFKIFALKVTPDLVDRKQEDITQKDTVPISIYDPLDLLDWNKHKYPNNHEFIQINENLIKQRGLFTYQRKVGFDIAEHFKNNPDPTRYQEISGEIDPNANVLDSIRIGYPNLFKTEWYFKNACEKANEILPPVVRQK